MKKRILILILLIAIISTIPLTFISCDKVSNEDLFWQMMEFNGYTYPTTVEVLSDFSNKEEIYYREAMDCFGKLKFEQDFEEDGMDKIKHMIYDLKSKKIVYEKIVNAVDTYDLYFDDLLIKEEAVVDSKNVYNYYSANMELITSSETELTTSTDYKNVVIGEKTYKINKDGSLSTKKIDTVSFKKGEASCYTSPNEIVIKNAKGKVIYNEKLNSMVKVFNYLGDTLIRQEIIELPSTEKKYTYIENGKKYKVEQKILTVKKNKVKESKIKDVKYLIQEVEIFEKTDSLYMAPYEELFEKAYSKIAVVKFDEILNQNLLPQVGGYFNADFERILDAFTSDDYLHVSGDSVSVTRNSKYYIYDKQGNLKHDLSDYTVERRFDLLVIDDVVYDYDLNEVLTIDSKQTYTNNYNNYVYSVENEKVEATDPTTSAFFEYNKKTGKFDKKYDKVVDAAYDRIININQDGTYTYNLIKYDCIDPIEVPSSVKSMLTITKDEYESGVLNISSDWINMVDGSSMVLYEIRKLVDGKVTKQYVITK